MFYAWKLTFMQKIKDANDLNNFTSMYVHKYIQKPYFFRNICKIL